MSLSLEDYQLTLEDLVNETVTNCDTSSEWEEDHITLQIIGEFRRKLGRVQNLTGRHKLKVHWSAFRQNRKRWGDVGIIVNITYNDGLSLKGGTILEAKKRSRGSLAFDAINPAQLESVETRAPHAMLLLYDYDKITKFALEPLLGDVRRPYRPVPLTTFTHSVVTPIGLARTTSWRNTSLYRPSLPFSYQLCFRYFSGLDLDFGPELIEVLEGRAETGSPKYLLVFSIAQGNAELSTDVGPSPESYSQLGDEEM